jgi:TRAP-type C4-dicarboxylate transport system permease small subunit
VTALRRLAALSNRAIDATLAAGLLLIAAILFLQVVQRYGFRAALPWPEELAGFLLVYVSLLGAYRAFGTGGHMAFEVIARDTARPLLVLLRIIGQLLIVAFLLVLVYGGVALAALAGEQPSTALRLPMWIPYMITPVAAALMAVASILQLVDLVTRLMPRWRRRTAAATFGPGDRA